VAGRAGTGAAAFGLDARHGVADAFSMTVEPFSASTSKRVPSKGSTARIDR
jgi:hypothetical protein